MKKAFVGMLVFIGLFVGLVTRLSAQMNLLHEFKARDGYAPLGNLITDGTCCYGITQFGGDKDQGIIFKINFDGSGFTSLHSFNGADGFWPSGSLIASGGVLYGMARFGGASNLGTIFKINPNGSGFTLLHSFAGEPGDGNVPRGSLIESGGTLYGMTAQGGASDQGTIFKINSDGNGFALLHSFAGGDGSLPYGSLIGSGGALYGMTVNGGASNQGTIFKINSDGNGFALLHSFAGGAGDGTYPNGSLIVSGGALYGMTAYGGASNQGTIFKINSDGNGFTLLHSFAGGVGDGSSPYGSLIVSGGTFYGMTSYGGANDKGTIFKINPDGGGFALLRSFAGGAEDGKNPYDSLLEAGGALYGMTLTGGADDVGTIFKINPDGGGFALFHSFFLSAEDGKEPHGSLLESGGALYGMTTYGGHDNKGTIFKIDPAGGGYARLHSFAGGAGDGREPHGSLIESGGALYGMTSLGGANGYGTIFKMNPDGSDFVLLHSFGGGAEDGKNPKGSLLELGGALYGMTELGGASGADGYGTIFKINPNGTGFTLLYTFPGGAGDGRNPTGSLIESGGALYGVTYLGGGTYNTGTLFKINPDGGGFALLHSFVGGYEDGFYPRDSLLDLAGCSTE